MGVHRDRFGDASQQQSLESAPPMRADNDQVGGPFLRFL